MVNPSDLLYVLLYARGKSRRDNENIPSKIHLQKELMEQIDNMEFKIKAISEENLIKKAIKNYNDFHETMVILLSLSLKCLDHIALGTIPK